MYRLLMSLFFCFLIVNNFAQSFRNGFDKRDASSSGGNGNGASFHSNVSSKIHNDETVFLKGYINMFLATKDKKYLDQFIIHAKRVQERRDDNIMQIQYQLEDFFPAIVPVSTEAPCYDEDDFQFCTKPFASMSEINTASKGWSYVDKPCDCVISKPAVVQSGEITYPMALFVWYMQSDPAFMALANEQVPLEAQTVLPSENCATTSILTYQDFANWLECRIDETIMYHEDPDDDIDNWGWEENNDLDYGDGVTYSHYRDENLNGNTSIGRTIALMYLITGDSWYHQRTTDIALLTHAHLTEDEDLRTMVVNGETVEFYSWRYGWGMHECVEDIAHAYLTMEFAEVCHVNNITHVNDGYQLFNQTDMERFANTVAHRIYKNPNEVWDNTYGGIQNVCGTGGAWAYPFLAKYNPYIYEMYVSYSGYSPFTGGTHLVQSSELAKLQSPEFMNGENFKFNPISTRLSSATNFKHYTVTGDFNGDGKTDYSVAETDNTNASIFKFYNPSNCTNPNVGDCWNEVNSNAIPAQNWLGIAGGNFDESLYSLNHLGDEIFALHPDGSIYYIENNLSSVNVESIGTSHAWSGAASNDFISSHPGDEGVFVTTTGDVYFAEYNSSGITLSSLITATGINDVKGITSGQFDNTIPEKQIAILDEEYNYISIFKYNELADEFLIIHQFTGFGINMNWQSITSGDFDGDGIDELVCYSEKKGEMFVLKVKSTGLEIIYTEYFREGQEIFSLASGSFGFSATNEQLLVARNFDGRVTFYEIFGECPGLNLNGVTINTGTSINNDLVFIQNDYPIDYHVNNTLTASNVTIQGATVDFSAGHAVVLKPGTTVYQGSEFRAHISSDLSCGSDYFLKNHIQSNDYKDNYERERIVENDRPNEKPLSLRVIPNPSNGNFTIAFENSDEFGNAAYEIYSAEGKIMQSGILNSNRTVINAENFSPGIYFLIVKSVNENTKIKLVIN